MWCRVVNSVVEFSLCFKMCIWEAWISINNVDRIMLYSTNLFATQQFWIFPSWRLFTSLVNQHTNVEWGSVKCHDMSPSHDMHIYKSNLSFILCEAWTSTNLMFTNHYTSCSWTCIDASNLETYFRVIHKVSRLGAKNGQFWHSRASNV